MKYGSLCSGIGGLGMAVEAVFADAELAWHAEYAAAPAAIHDRHWPGVPNLHDITTVDWQSVPPVDLICAGWPCQPFSHAGKRQGESDERHLWPYIADAVRVLRPRWLLGENVGGHLSLGLGTVLGDLAEAGYDTEWCCVRASDVGAPHGRLRLFILAADTRGARHPEAAGGPPPQEGRLRRRGDDHVAHGDDTPVHDDGGVVEQAPADACGGGREVSPEPDGEPVEPRLGAPRRHDPHRRRPTPADTEDAGRERVGQSRGRRTGPTDGRVAAPDADSTGLEGGEPAEGRHLPPGCAEAALHPARVGRRTEGIVGRLGTQERSEIAWGPYEPAIRRWERLTRPAPAPTDERGRLSPAFVEWMMGYPDGWTDGHSRAERLKALGNSVCPQQGAHALSILVETAA